ncbi:hypothetical protein HHO41_21490 [Bacillus sp. DNRA2]|uniref:hypothetical protein n=1 Tax=Bacillus sp. DNRA2 TaxID=2723053 RepID=UPI00145C8C30|nr:hypothetical protein [Bacillus sp. DNRA2]NMD72799.1 hypothetical protein [Bacillus sp. DNRA2]
MSRKPDIVALWRSKDIPVIEKRGWVRVVRSIAKQRLSEQEYISCMKQVGWESII